MKKIFLSVLAVFILCVQNFCCAATIESKNFNGNENLIYPVVHVADSSAEKKINVAIVAEIDRFLTGIYRNAQVNGFQVADVRTNFEIACNEAGNTVILSLLLTESNYYKGAAHPSTFLRALNFNLSNGELIDKNYLLDVGSGVPESHFVAKLEKKLREKIAREKIFLFDNVLPLKNLPENFYWDENLHLHFIFQQYDIAPYAAGIIDVDIDA